MTNAIIYSFGKFNGRRYGTPWVCRMTEDGKYDFSTRVGTYTDNGTEFSKPEEIEENEYGEILTSVFYCHPLASWEKGDCENNHAMIRRILPKGSTFSSLTQEKVDLMMNHINSYPRPQYNGKTPYEMFVFFYGQELADKLGLRSINRNEVTLKPSLLK